MKKILLASQSPRRKELMEKMGFAFELMSVEAEETYPPDLEASEVAGYVAEQKSTFYQNIGEDEILLTADTVVVYQNHVFGKPKTCEGARTMLRKLSGNTHDVYTAVSVKTYTERFTFTDKAQVSFFSIDESEIDYYIKNYAPFDKSGAYGIHDWIGVTKISAINGNFYTVMGLPTHWVYKTLKELV
ncbi:MAG: septum formation protein Maf [Bergeyella sp.]|nr:septum formation protein Maf [Bergeyella sp.]